MGILKLLDRSVATSAATLMSDLSIVSGFTWPYVAGYYRLPVRTLVGAELKGRQWKAQEPVGGCQVSSRLLSFGYSPGRGEESGSRHTV